MSILRYICSLFYLVFVFNRSWRNTPINPCRLSQTMYMSKMTAAILDDLDYIVDPSAVSLDIVHAVDSHHEGRRGIIMVSQIPSTNRSSNI